MRFLGWLSANSSGRLLQLPTRSPASEDQPSGWLLQLPMRFLGHLSDRGHTKPIRTASSAPHAFPGSISSNLPMRKKRPSTSSCQKYHGTSARRSSRFCWSRLSEKSIRPHLAAIAHRFRTDRLQTSSRLSTKHVRIISHRRRPRIALPMMLGWNGWSVPSGASRSSHQPD